MARKTKANKFLIIIMTLILLSMILSTLATLARAETLNIPAMTKSAVFTIGSDMVTVDGQTYKMDVAPYIDANGRTQVPVRYLGDVLGMTATWDATTKTVKLTEQKFSAQENLVIGNNKLGWANGVQDGVTTMDTVPVVVPPGRTMLPARWVAQAIGYTVTWNAANQTVTVTPQATQSGGSDNEPPLVGGTITSTGGNSGTNPGPDSQPPVYPSQ